MDKKEIILRAVLNFLDVTNRCYISTPYTEDRLAFQSDIALCAQWILDVELNIELDKVVADIFDLSTEKHIVDYFKKGEFGDDQADAFVKLKGDLKNFKNDNK